MTRIRLIKREALGKINAAELAETPVADITSPEYMDVLRMAAKLEKSGYPTAWHIANGLGLSQQTTRKRLNALKVAGLLEVSRRGVFNYFHPTPAGKTALAP